MVAVFVVAAILGLIAGWVLLFIGAAAILASYPATAERRVKVIIPWWYWPLAWLLFVGSITVLDIVGDQ